MAGNPYHDAKGLFTTKGLAVGLGAPSYALIHETGGEHGGGTIDFSTSKTSRADLLKALKKAGFQKASSKGHTETTKLGRSAAYSSAKVMLNKLAHPDGHTAMIKTSTSMGQSRSSVSIHTKK